MAPPVKHSTQCVSRPRYLTPGKLAKRHDVHRSTIWRGIKSGRLKTIILNKRVLVLDPAEETAPQHT
jgi:hypothetical protein